MKVRVRVTGLCSTSSLGAHQVSNHAPSNMLLTCYQPNVTCISMNIQSCSKYVSACSIRVKLPKVVVVSVKKASWYGFVQLVTNDSVVLVNQTPTAS